MSCLHIINRIISEAQLETVNSALSGGDQLLLIEDACYLAQNEQLSAKLAGTLGLQTDAKVRGIELSDRIQWIENYDAMVELVIAHDKTLTWTFG